MIENSRSKNGYLLKREALFPALDNDDDSIYVYRFYKIKTGVLMGDIFLSNDGLEYYNYLDPRATDVCYHSLFEIYDDEGMLKLEDKLSELLIIGKKDSNGIPYVIYVPVKEILYLYSNITEGEDLEEKEVANSIVLLKQKLSEAIIGQDKAIEKICYVLWKNSLLSDEERKTACLLIGPTGSGKSQIIDIIKNHYPFPLVHVDSTTLSAPGYVGSDIEDELSKLYKAAGEDLELAQRGILVFDEIDKKSSEKNSDISGRAVLNQLLRICDGQTYSIEVKDSKTGRRKTLDFSTKNLTVIGLGSFAHVFEKKELNSKKAGFGADLSNQQEINITADDIIKHGDMGKEFIGRFMIIPLNKLTKENLINILKTSPISELLIGIKCLMEANIYLEYDDLFIEEIAKRAIEEKTGGRAIKNIVDNLLSEIFNKIIINGNYDIINLSATALNGEFIIIDIDSKECIIGNDRVNVKRFVKN